MYGSLLIGAPVVMEVLETKNEDFRKKYPRWFPESGSARASGSYGQSRENRALSFCKGRMDRDESLPTLTGRLKADWIHLPVDDVLALFPTVREGICMGVFRQKAAATWFLVAAAILLFNSSFYIASYGLSTRLPLPPLCS